MIGDQREALDPRGEGFANTPEPPYWAVIFTSRLSAESEDYPEAAKRMAELAAQQPGFLGLESARADLGVTVSYWRDELAIRSWRQHLEHQRAQHQGRSRWYDAFTIRIARVKRAYGMP